MTVYGAPAREEQKGDEPIAPSSSYDTSFVELDEIDPHLLGRSHSYSGLPSDAWYRHPDANTSIEPPPPGPPSMYAAASSSTPPFSMIGTPLVSNVRPVGTSPSVMDLETEFSTHDPVAAMPALRAPHPHPLHEAPPSPFHRDPALSPRPESRPVLQSMQSPVGQRFLLHKRKSSRHMLQSPAAVAAAVWQESAPSNDEFPLLHSMCYRGYEVIFASMVVSSAKSEERQDAIRILHARTRLPAFVALPSQHGADHHVTVGKINLPKNERVVAMTGNVTTGHVVVVTHTGLLVLLTPEVCSARKYPSGKYAWNCRAIWDVCDVFIPANNTSTRVLMVDPLSPRRSLFSLRLQSQENNFDSVEISLSVDDKLLVAHQDQLAVFDLDAGTSVIQAMEEKHQLHQTYDALHPVIRGASDIIAWTKKLSSEVVAADMSADGTVIAYVMKQAQKQQSQNQETKDEHEKKEGEEERKDEQSPLVHGIHTFVRDMNDGSYLLTPVKVSSLDSNESIILTPRTMPRKRQTSIGIVYKPSTFLVHEAPVTSLKWRGKGDNMPTCNPLEHNDLLLTHCHSDSSFRVYAQAKLEQILHWVAPPHSVAAWVDGISSANLGDLTDKSGAISNEDIAMGSAASMQQAMQNSPMIQSAILGNVTGGGAATGRGLGYGYPVVPTSAAGAWICEVTFRGSFPALRLSRLNFVKGANAFSAKNAAGGGSYPAHFESVAVMLPPGTIPGLPSPITGKREPTKQHNSIPRVQDILQMSVQGIWSAWDIPPAACTGTTHHMERWMGGSHAPPSELRLIASHSSWGRNVLTVLEFPLWGEADLGINVEFGTPIRHLLSLSPVTSTTDEERDDDKLVVKKKSKQDSDAIEGSQCSLATLHLPCSALVARVSPDGETIILENRVIGSTSVLPLSHSTCDFGLGRTHQRAQSNSSLTSLCTHNSSTFLHWDAEDQTHSIQNGVLSTSMQRFVDVSVTPLPNFLPPLRKYRSGLKNKSRHDRSEHLITSLHWWPTGSGDPSFPLVDSTESYTLLAVTRGGTLIVYEIPAPYRAAEPPMPSIDENVPSIVPSASTASSSVAPSDALDASFHESPTPQNLHIIHQLRPEYEVILLPHVDFGIGLRLESRSTPYNPYTAEIAIAGSYKKHPLSGSRLPAEKSGMIVLGDALVGVNDIDLSRQSFDEIIEMVRNVGSNAAKTGTPLKLKFRPVDQWSKSGSFDPGMKDSVAGSSLGSTFDSLGVLPTNVLVPPSPKPSPSPGKRRSIEEILGIQHHPSVAQPRSRTSTFESPGRLENGFDPFSGSVYDSSCASAATLNVGAEAETQQEFGRIVGVARTEIIENGNFLSCSLVLPWKENGKQLNGGRDDDTRSQCGVEEVSCLFVTARERTLVVSRVTLTCLDNISPNPEENVSLKFLGRVAINEAHSEDEIRILSLIQVSTANKGWCVAATDSLGSLTLVFLEYEAHTEKVTFRVYDGLTSPVSNARKVLVRPSSLDLLATLIVPDIQNDDIREKVIIWSAWPNCEVLRDDAKDGKKLSDRFYAPSEIELPFPALPNERIVDIQWLSPHPTMLNTFPQIALWTTGRAVVYRRSHPESSIEWKAILDVQYCESLIGTAAESPIVIWPHLASTLNSLTSNTNSVGSLSALNSSIQARADWHPDVLVASILNDSRGVHSALRGKKKDSKVKRSFVSGLIHWLSRWTCPDESERPLWGNHVWSVTERNENENKEKNPGVGNVIPLTTLRVSGRENKGAAVARQNSTDTEEEVEDAAHLMASFNISSRRIGSPASATLDEEEMLLEELLEVIKTYLNSHSVFAKESTPEGKPQQITSLAHRTSRRSVDVKPSSPSPYPSLPRPVADFNLRELACLYAIVRLYHAPPVFKGLDMPAQMALFAIEISRHVFSIDGRVPSGSGSGLQRPTGFVNVLDNQSGQGKRSATFCAFSSEDDDATNIPPIGSGAALCALVSSCQLDLLARCTSQLGLPNKKMDWSTARRLLIPFWLRDISELRRVSEEIAMNIFKSTRDVMECALLFVAMRKMPTLMNLARTDDTLSGKTFFKFLQSYDFSSPLGRKAAEKNAYSLLRKRRYGVSAAFFLLAEPPMLNTALEVITCNMEDVGLALLVARLIESARSSLSKLGGTGIFEPNGSRQLNLAGLGGGGGFVSVAPTSHGLTCDQESFDEWSPNLGTTTCEMLRSRGLAKAVERNDAPFAAILHLWMGERDQAALSVLALKKDKDMVFPLPSLGSSSTSDQKVFSSGIMGRSKGVAKQASVTLFHEVVSCFNSHLNFGCRYLVLRTLNVPQRAQWCALLQIASAYSRCGIELTSINLLQSIQPEQEQDAKNASFKVESAAGPLTGNPSSSVFDSFDVAPQKPKQTVPGNATFVASRAEMGSSIFDSFDVQPLKSTSKTAVGPQVPSSSGGMSSSIFDSFDVAPAKPKPKPPVAPPSGEMSSSVFDSFDVATQKPKVKAVPPHSVVSSGEGISSIFDSFDVAPPKPKSKPPETSSVAVSSGEMRSSIFDSFDNATPKPKQKPSGTVLVAPSSGEMCSSIFDSFDVSPQKPKRESIVEGSSNTCTIPCSVPADAAETNTRTDTIVVDFGHLPTLWQEWKAQLLIAVVARRLLREVSRVCSLFHGDLPDPALHQFRRNVYPIVPHGSAEVVQHACDVDVVTGLQDCLRELCSLSGLEDGDVVKKAFQLLRNDGQGHDYFPAPSILCSAILHSLVQRADLAESVVADASKKQIQLCASYAIANDEFRFRRRSKFYLSSHIIRRHAVQTSWQLELCLWLHRGGNLSLSGKVLKETIVAVRVGLLLGSWGRCHETLESIIKCDPDCTLDFQAGRQLWTSWKIMNNPEDQGKKKNSRCGGWEFLVDCKRADATDMLRSKRTGAFLLRPHPEDHGVFTLSFKTNLVATTPGQSSGKSDASKVKEVEPDDVVQHAILRLSDAGFRCGSFGPFGSLIKLLEAVSESLPFDLLFDEPPSEGIIKDEGEQPSPNSFLVRKLALHSRVDRFTWNSLHGEAAIEEVTQGEEEGSSDDESVKDEISRDMEKTVSRRETRSDRKRMFGMFIQLLALTEVTKQLCAVGGADIDESFADDAAVRKTKLVDNDEYQESVIDEDEEDDAYTMSSRTLRPLLEWRRTLEVELVSDFAPALSFTSQALAMLPVAVAATDTAIEAIPSVSASGSAVTGGDALIRRMIQLGSGVEFRTLRVGEGWNSAMVVLFSRKEAIPWIVSSGTEKDVADAAARLKWMEKRRVIESVNIDELVALWHGKKLDSSSDESTKVRYRFVDPWEVEPLENREAELSEAVLGRECYVPFSVSVVARACEKMQRAIGGIHLLSLWGTVKGGIFLTKAIACILPPWESDAGSDLQTNEGLTAEPTPYINSIRKHLYRNQIFRRLHLPQRFLAMVQVELLDLKNLTSPGGTSHITAYAILRLKRPSSNAPLSHKAKTLDSATTYPRKIGKSSGPHSPASWGSLVRFRYPLPEDVNCDGVSFDADREAIFKGPPSVLHLVIYEKKFMTDLSLGIADVSLDALSCGGQLEEWVPLRAGKSGTTWFTRIRITLRFELMCINTEEKLASEGGLVIDPSSPAMEEETVDSLGTAKISKLSVGMKKITELSRGGGLHEDTKAVKRTESSPDFFGYLESMVG